MRRFMGVMLVMLCCCAPTVRESFQRDALARASYEMRCPADQLQITGLNKGLDETLINGEQVGVDGCGQRVVYVNVYPTGWVANTQSSGSP